MVRIDRHNGADPFLLAGKVAFVTGSARGIGRATALALAQAGATVACADREDPGETVHELHVLGGDGWGAVVDVTSADAVQAFVEGVVQRTGRLDAAVNNAAVLQRASALDVTGEMLDSINRVNVSGVLHGCQAAAVVMIRQGSGSIVNVASSSIDSSMAGNLAYSTSKVAVRQMSRTMAREWGPHGVRVNVVAPGWLETDLTRLADVPRNAADPADALETKRRSVRHGRALRDDGSVDDVANTIRFLISDASRWISGQALRVDGGGGMAW